MGTLWNNRSLLLRVYAGLSLAFAWQTYTVRDILFQEASSAIVHLQFWLWFIALTLLLFLRIPRVALWLHFVLHTLLIQQTAFGVEVYLYAMPAFWMLFLFAGGSFIARKTTSERFELWPFWYVGLILACWFSSAGYAKLLDPLWSSGVGLARVFSLRWICLVDMGYLTTDTSVSRLLNYVIIVFEVISLPLYLFRKTRIPLLFGWGVFFGLCVFPLRLGFIGLFGLWCVWAILLYELGHEDIEQINQVPYRITLLKRCASVWATVAVIVFLWQSYRLDTATFRSHPRFAFSSSQSFTKPLSSPDTKAGAVLPRSGDTPAWWWSASRWVRRYVRILLDYTIHPSPMYVFTYREVLGVYAYRIIVRHEDGSTSEPIRVFENDLTGGFDTQGFLAPRWLQTLIYPLSWIPSRLGGSSSSVTPHQRETVRRLFRLAARRQNLDEATFSRFELWLSPLRYSSQQLGQPLWQQVAYREGIDSPLHFLPISRGTEEQFTLFDSAGKQRMSVKVRR